ANVRSVFNKFGGTLGTSGSLDFMFSWKSMFTIAKKEGLEMDELILELIDYGVEDEYDEDEEEITIYGDPKSFAQIQKYLEDNGFEVKGAEFTRIPNDEKELNDEQRATIDKMVERLEDDEDVQNVYTNMKPASEDEE
ncbi:YebC/PmpR family DNA-binding transcriptional regulator, partial [Escherichia coli]|nr:YebC/PmpR family DNA-binding transcriptional regulator [Escherichia coli]